MGLCNKQPPMVEVKTKIKKIIFILHSTEYKPESYLKLIIHSKYLASL